MRTDGRVLRVCTLAATAAFSLCVVVGATAATAPISAKRLVLQKADVGATATVYADVTGAAAAIRGFEKFTTSAKARTAMQKAQRWQVGWRVGQTLTVSNALVYKTPAEATLVAKEFPRSEVGATLTPTAAPSSLGKNVWLGSGAAGDTQLVLVVIREGRITFGVSYYYTAANSTPAAARTRLIALAKRQRAHVLRALK